MMGAGLVAATVNSDAPAYFGGYINDDYLQVAEALDLSAAEIRLPIGNSRAAAFSTDGAGCQRPLKRISDTRPTLRLAEEQGKLSPLKR